MGRGRGKSGSGAGWQGAATPSKLHTLTTSFSERCVTSGGSLDIRKSKTFFVPNPIACREVCVIGGVECNSEVYNNLFPSINERCAASNGGDFLIFSLALSR